MCVAMHFAAAAQVLLRLEFSAQGTVDSVPAGFSLSTAHCSLLLRVQFDDELLVDGQVDVDTPGQVQNTT
jgi:hypothetical protein